MGSFRCAKAGHADELDIRLPAIRIPFLGSSVSRTASEHAWEQRLLGFERAPKILCRLHPATDVLHRNVPSCSRRCAAREGFRAFDLTSVTFSTILFLDEEASDPIVRVEMLSEGSNPGRINITSHKDDGSSDAHRPWT